MNHYLEIKEVTKVGAQYFELWLQTGTGPEFWIGSHSLERIEGMADHIATSEAPNGIDKMNIQNNPRKNASVPLVESYAHMRSGS